MSTSSSPGRGEPSASEVRPFAYPAAPLREASPGSQGDSDSWSGAIGLPTAGSATDIALLEQKAREEGSREGEARARAEFLEMLARERTVLAGALADFARERESYYQQVESELVQLALSIARKILHREAQVDPLLLAGVVRVALDQIRGGSLPVVRVHPAHVADWRSFFAQQLELRDQPQVVEDASLPTDHCLIETQLGSTELSLEGQLKEIEQGFLDLLERRPRANG